jgi:hypothetical protein
MTEPKKAYKTGTGGVLTDGLGRADGLNTAGHSRKLPGLGLACAACQAEGLIPWGVTLRRDDRRG